MRIEQELKTDKYDVWQQLHINIKLSSNWLADHVKEFLSPYGITQKQFNILRILRGQKGEGLTILEIRDRMIDRMSDTSRLIDRLGKKELVFKCTCSLDKRANRVCITEKGLELLASIDTRMPDFKISMSDLSEEEACILNKLLTKLRNQNPPQI